MDARDCDTPCAHARSLAHYRHERVRRGTGAAVARRMAQNHRPIAKSYEEIVRATVPDPDSSWRPSIEAERRANEGERELDDEEKELYARVCDKLLSIPDVDVSGVQVEVERTRVYLRGHVSDYRDLPRIESCVSSIEGLDEIVDYLVVDASRR